MVCPPAMTFSRATSLPSKLQEPKRFHFPKLEGGGAVLGLPIEGPASLSWAPTKAGPWPQLYSGWRAGSPPGIQSPQDKGGQMRPVVWGGSKNRAE